MDPSKKQDISFSRRKFLKTASQSALVVGFGAGLTSCGEGDVNFNVTINGPGSNPEVNVIVTPPPSSGQQRLQGDSSQKSKKPKKKSGGTVSLLSGDEISYSNDDSEDLIVGYVASDPTIPLILTPGQSVLITNALGGSGTIENTSTSSIFIGSIEYLPGDVATWTQN